MKYLITGITGFAGPHLAKLLLSEGHEVWGLIRGSNGRQMDLLDVMTESQIGAIHWTYGDLLDYPSIQKILSATQFDGVFHLAAQSHPPTSFIQPPLTFEVNVMGSVNLLDCIKKHQEHKCRLHFCSTSEVYGDQDCLLTESAQIKPANPYGASKAAIDLYMQERIRNKFVSGFVTRAFSHTGPRRGHRFSISSDAFQLARMKLSLQDKVLLVGNLQTERVVMDVRDCVRAYYMLMQSFQLPEHPVFNICGQAVHPMQHYTDLLIEESGIEGVVKKIHKPFYRPVDIAVQRGDCRRLQKQTRWKPKIPLRQTMADLLDYWVCKLRED